MKLKQLVEHRNSEYSRKTEEITSVFSSKISKSLALIFKEDATKCKIIDCLDTSTVHCDVLILRILVNNSEYTNTLLSLAIPYTLLEEHVSFTIIHGYIKALMKLLNDSPEITSDELYQFYMKYAKPVAGSELLDYNKQMDTSEIEFIHEPVMTVQ